MEDWSDVTPDSVDDDTVGNPYAERDENDGRLFYESTDPEGRWTPGNIIRKEGAMCLGKTEQRDWGGPDPISDSELMMHTSIEVTSEPPKNKCIVFPLPLTLPIPAPASFAPGTVSIPTTVNANQSTGVGTTQVAAAIPLQTSKASIQEIVEAEGGKKDPPNYCYTKGCQNHGSIQPFKKQRRVYTREIRYCIPCNNHRLGQINSEKSLQRKKKLVTKARSTLYGWDQTANIAYHEEPKSLDFIKGKCIVGSFSRDFMYQWIISNRQILGPVNTVMKAHESPNVWTKIAHTGNPSKGLYKVFSQNETHGWENQVTKAMGGTSDDPRHNPNLFPICLFVKELKRKLGFTGPKNLTCRVKYGLVITVQDYVQAPHQDCQVTPDNPSWIFHVPLCKGGSYLYIWEDDRKEKKLVWIPLGSFLVLRDDVWHGGLCGGAGNVRVHGGIFDSMAIESTGILAYPPSTSLANYMKGHNSKHNRKGSGVNYENAINLVGKILRNRCLRW